MSRANPIQVSFNAGELSPRMLARVDRPQYANGCYRMRNFIPDLAGPAVKRGGTRFVAAAKSNADAAWLVRFQMSASESYILEFGPFYIRFFRNRARVLTGALLPYETATPYSADDLVNDDGSFALKFIQSGDIIYIASAAHAPRKLVRQGETNWPLLVYEPTGGPFQDVNVISPVTLKSSNVIGVVTITASANFFSAADVGKKLYIESATISNVPQWEAGKVVAAGAQRRVGLRLYVAATAGTTGSVTPTHTEGSVYDGDAGVQWAFNSPGYGSGKITGFISPTDVTMLVENRLPYTVWDIPGVVVPTTKWAFGEWDAQRGFPTQVTFYYDRLVWGRGSQIWMTVSGDYENMLDRDLGGRQTVESAISLFVPSRRGSTVVWLEPLEQSLIIGTGIDEWLISPASRNEPLGPLNISVLPLSAIGSRDVPAVRTFDSIIFAQRTGKRLRDLKYTAQDGLQRLDLNILADHILGLGVKSMTYGKEPNSLVMASLFDGKLASGMYYPEQELLGWSLWETDGLIECVETIPSPDGKTDDVWIVVRRTVNGSVARYIEYFSQPLGDNESAVENAFYVDSSTLTQPGVAQTSWPTAAPHLVGKTVNALGDGVAFKGLVVGAGGAVTTPVPVFNLVVGLPYTATLASMDIEAGAQAGTAQNKSRRIHRMGVRLHRTLGGRCGPTEAKLESLRYRQPGEGGALPIPLFTGDLDFSMQGGTEKVCRAWFVHDDPTPATVLGFIPRLQTNDIS
jgi:hypothetical protein